MQKGLQREVQVKDEKHGSDKAAIVGMLTVPGVHVSGMLQHTTRRAGRHALTIEAPGQPYMCANADFGIAFSCSVDVA